MVAKSTKKTAKTPSFKILEEPTPAPKIETPRVEAPNSAPLSQDKKRLLIYGAVAAAAIFLLFPKKKQKEKERESTATSPLEPAPVMAEEYFRVSK